MIELTLFIFGLFFGSFLGVVTDRLKNGESIISGRSHCEKCKKELGVLDLIPVLSFIFLLGRCRYCKTKLSFIYPLIELSTGIIFSLIFYFFKNESILTLLYYYTIISGFIVIFYSDLKYGIIPDKVVIPLSIISLIYISLINPVLLIPNLISGIGALIFFIVISYVFFILTKKESMGGGDVKLSLLLGLFLGLPGIVVSLYLAFLTGAIISIILILWKKKTFLKDSLPFGPFLIMAALISFFFGSFIFQLALRILGL
jgi:prepilin signal peptidase PulO-like enzyme (type II secretory pathway)